MAFQHFRSPALKQANAKISSGKTDCWILKLDDDYM
jgi:hypothetical protein